MSVSEALRMVGGVDVWVRRGLALALVAAVSLLLMAMRGRLARRLTRYAASTPGRVDDLLAEIVRRTLAIFPIAISIFLVIAILPLSPQVERFARGLAIILSLLQIGVWGSIAVRAIIERQFAAESTDPSDTARAGVARMAAFGARVLLWSVLTLVALANLGVDVTALVAGLGVGGVAVALATQNILGDLFASFSILLDKPFVPGDFIVVGDFMGSIEQIGVKTTRVRGLGGEQIVFSNNDLLQSRLRNYKRMRERRVLFELRVVYETNVENLRAIPGMIREVVLARERTRFDRAHFAKYGDFSLHFEVVYYVLDADYNVYMDIQHAINLEIFQRFAAAGIEFAYPTQTVLIQPPKDVTDGGEPRDLSVTRTRRAAG